jgi:hypothetical protein
LALKQKFAFSSPLSPPKRPEQVLWVAVLSRAALDVRHGSEQEALSVLGWIERDREEFEQVISLAGLESGHAERFERAMRAAFQTRFRRTPSLIQGVRVFDGSNTLPPPVVISS